MPEAAEEEDNHDIPHSAQTAVPAPAEREIDIPGEKALERDMPVLPEFLHRSGPVGRVEVDRKGDAEHPADSHGHVAVAAEVKI